MKFAFDLDQTISEAPEQFAAIANSLLENGHEVHVITYRDPIYHKEATIEELKEYGFGYTELHITGQKEELCQMYKMDMAIDDCAAYHYPNCWRFTLGFALPNKEATSYMKEEGKGMFRIAGGKLSDKYLADRNSTDYKEGYKNGWESGYEQGFDDAKEYNTLESNK